MQAGKSWRASMSAANTELAIKKPLYLFEILDNRGETLRRISRRCDGVTAHDRAESLLLATPGAAAVFGFENPGLQVHAAYRH